MKKLFLFILIFCFCKIGVTQSTFPIPQGLGSPVTLVTNKGGFTSTVALIVTSYADTTTANTSVYADSYSGAIIFTTGDNSLWVRNSTATAWIKISSSAGSTNIYNSDGTLSGNRTLTGGGNSLNFSGLSAFSAATTAGVTLENTNGTLFTSLQASTNSSIIKANKTSNGQSDILVYWDTLQIRPHLGRLYIDTLQAGGSSDALVTHNSTTGDVGRATTLPTALVPTWQQTLTAGSTLTGVNTITGGSHNFTWNASGNQTYNMTTGKRFLVNNSDAIYLESINGSQYAYSQIEYDNIESYVENGTGRSGFLAINSNLFDAYVDEPGRRNQFRMNLDSTWLNPHLGRINIDTIRAGTVTNTLVGWTNGTIDNGKLGYVTLGSGLSLSSGVLNTSGTVATPISSLTAATGTNSINNGAHLQNWQWNSISNDVGLAISSTSTAASGNTQSLVNILLSGTNANSTQKTEAAVISNAHDGTASTNVGLRVQATNGTAANYAIIVPTSGGNVGIGTSTPAKIFHTVGTVRHATLGTASSDTTTYKPMGIDTNGDVFPMTYWPGGGGGGVTTMAAIGSSPNANGATISGSTLTLQPASASFGGVVTAGTQTFSGNKTLEGNLIFTPTGTDNRSIDFGNGYGVPALKLYSTTYGWGLAPSNMQFFMDADAKFTVQSTGAFDATGAAEDFKVDGANDYIRMSLKTVIGGGMVPTAALHIRGGTAAANDASLKFGSGTLLTTAEAGAMEYNGTNLFFSPSTTRYTVQLALEGSATLDFADTAPSTSTDLTITVTGAADGDKVTLGVPNGSTAANSLFTAWVSAANTVTVRFLNIQTVGNINPASGSFKVSVIKP